VPESEQRMQRSYQIPDSNITREGGVTLQDTLVWGILGGMGPLASAEFLRTIYRCQPRYPEQNLPRVILFSDPTIPDRSKAIVTGQWQELYTPLVRGIETLRELGVSRVIVCCITIHPVIEKLPPESRGQVISLVDTIFEALIEVNEPHLLLCTEGARRSRVFENHRLWPAVRARVILPDDSDQAAIHRMIYDIKQIGPCSVQRSFVQQLLKKYEAASYIAGCTEIHLLQRMQRRSMNSPPLTVCIDPLSILALLINKECNRSV
jgi:aspartate racemase